MVFLRVAVLHNLYCIFYSNLQTILLQDREGENYCIACRELDTDTSKDDPGTLTLWFNILHAGEFFMLLLSSADFFQN